MLQKFYGLKIIAKHIEDDSKNVTRFLVMGKEIQHPELENKKYITSCIFRVKSKPAALYKCLGGFATNNVNLCKLESFSAKNTFEQVNFFYRYRRSYWRFKGSKIFRRTRFSYRKFGHFGRL